MFPMLALSVNSIRRLILIKFRLNGLISIAHFYFYELLRFKNGISAILRRIPPLI
jgi:hypothetical protein